MGARRIIKLTNQGSLELYEDLASGTNKIALRAPATLAGDITWTLPATDAVGFFRSDGAGGVTLVAGTSSLDDAYNNGSTITVDTGAVTWNVTANINGLRVFKSGTGTGSPISIENDGTSAGVAIQQDGASNAVSVTQNGAAVAVVIDRPTGGEIVRAIASTSGDAIVTAHTASSTRINRLGVLSAGNAFVGPSTSHALEIRTNDTARINIAAAANEVAIGGATESGVTLKVYGTVLVPNNTNISAEDSGGANRLILKLDGSNNIQIGDTAGTEATIISRQGVNLARFEEKKWTQTGPNGETITFENITELVSTNSGTGTKDTTILIPQDCILLGVTGRITTTITGCTTIDVGTVATQGKFATGLALTAGITFKSSGAGTEATPYYAKVTLGNVAVRITAVGGGAVLSTGAIRITIAYIQMTAPTS